MAQFASRTGFIPMRQPSFTGTQGGRSQAGFLSNSMPLSNQPSQYPPLSSTGSGSRQNLIAPFVGANGISNGTPSLQQDRQPSNSRVANGAPVSNGKGGFFDMVRFESTLYVTPEEDAHVRLNVIRIGDLGEPCSVDYRTAAASALPGEKYVEAEGTLHFDADELFKHLEVQIINDDAFDTNLEFAVYLENPQNCLLDREGIRARVMIADDDHFPDNTLAEDIDKGDSEALMRKGNTLLRGFMWLCYTHVPTVRWKTIVALMLAQLDNVYHYAMITLKIYLVDTVLNFQDPPKGPEPDDLLWHGSHTKTGLLLGALWILPNFGLLLAEYFDMKVLEIGFNCRKHLRVNLFRKYLCLTPESREEVPVQDLKTDIMDDIPDLVENGYLIVFEVFSMFGKILCFLIVLLQRHPESALPVLVYPVLIWVWLSCTYHTRLHLLAKIGDEESETMGWLIHADNSNRLITDYKQRSAVVDNFEDVLVSQRKSRMDLKDFNFWTNKLIPWITLLVIGLWIALGVGKVADGSMTKGFYLATINVYKDLGDKFQSVYRCFLEMSKVIDPLVGVTEHFNLETDLKLRLDVQREREKYTSEYIDAKGKTVGNGSVYDAIPIEFKNVKVQNSPSDSPFSVDGEGLSISADQGSIILISGPHGSGKASILELLTGVRDPTSGEVMCPLHLRVLNVSYNPCFIKTKNFYENMTFGKHRSDKDNPERVKRILHRLGLNADWMVETFDKHAEKATTAQDKKSKAKEKEAKEETSSGSDVDSDASDEYELLQPEEGKEEEEEGGGPEWIQNMSNSERKRAHIARAFVFNPEIMVLQRPVDELDPELQEPALKVIKEFVDCRGVEEDPVSFSIRRPRTVFLTCGNHHVAKIAPIADSVWKLGEGSQLVVEKGGRRRA